MPATCGYVTGVLTVFESLPRRVKKSQMSPFWPFLTLLNPEQVASFWSFLPKSEGNQAAPNVDGSS